jgi:hypothetical protein
MTTQEEIRQHSIERLLDQLEWWLQIGTAAEHQDGLHRPARRSEREPHQAARSGEAEG